MKNSNILRFSWVGHMKTPKIVFVGESHGKLKYFKGFVGESNGKLKYFKVFMGESREKLKYFKGFMGESHGKI